jgi:hypothetical protein
MFVPNKIASILEELITYCGLFAYPLRALRCVSEDGEFCDHLIFYDQISAYWGQDNPHEPIIQLTVDPCMPTYFGAHS